MVRGTGCERSRRYEKRRYVVNCHVDGQRGGDDDQDGQEEAQSEHEDVEAEV